MKKRQIALLILAAVVLFGGFYLLVKGLQDRMVDFPIKTMTEEKLSSLLGAKVTINYVKFGLIRQVSLSGLNIRSENKKNQNFNLASIRGIVFQYNILNLLTRNFSNPPKVILESPKLSLTNFELPEGLYEREAPEKKAANFLGRTVQIAVRRGEISYPFMEDKYRVGLTSIDGTVTPAGEDTINLKLSGLGTGVIRGVLGISGAINPKTKNYNLDLTFKKAGEILLPGFLRFKKISGTFHLQPKRLSFEKVRFSLADLLFEARGDILNFQSSTPTIHLTFKMMLGRMPLEFSINLDFPKEELSGSFLSGKDRFPFAGLLFVEESSIRVSEVKIQGGYTLSADLNVDENEFQLSCEKDPFRLNVNFSFDDWDVVTAINLEHLVLQNTDIVAFLKLRLSPTEELKKDKKWEFAGTLKTDYLIFDTEPINDMDGTFRIEQFKVKDINIAWGRNGKILGAYDPFSAKDTVVTVQMDKLDLSSLKRLFFYARPKKFGGVASGKINLRGDFRRPYISGDVEIEDGVLSNVRYRAAYLRFAGYYPYLRLSDSQLTRGKGTLYLKGDLDLKANNIFQDLQVISEDHVVVWRGIILSENLDENLVMIGEGIKRKLTE